MSGTHKSYCQRCRGVSAIFCLWVLATAIFNLAALSTALLSRFELHGTTRSGQCSDLPPWLDVLPAAWESSPRALRTNTLVSAVAAMLTSAFPFLVMFVVPPVTAGLRFGQPMHGIAADGCVGWTLLAMNTVLKQFCRQLRPDAYVRCILPPSSSPSFGMPSGHTMWSVGMWLVVHRPRFSLAVETPVRTGIRSYDPHRWPSWVQKHLCNWQPVAAAVLFLVNIPLVRFDLQYHSLAQIFIGMVAAAASALILCQLHGIAIGTAGVRLGSLIVNLKFMRFVAFCGWMQCVWATTSGIDK
eukprot:SAG31_NODE_201_length_20535_cov_15.315081_10_plen_299_part_00